MYVCSKFVNAQCRIDNRLVARLLPMISKKLCFASDVIGVF
jgi:hypothetical protein